MHSRPERALHSRPQVLRALGISLSITVGSMVLVSCSSAPQPDTESGSEGLDIGGIDLDQYSTVSAQLDFGKGIVTLPIDAIRRDSAQVTELRDQARRALVDTCARASGLPSVAWAPFSQINLDGRLYGLWSVSLATRYGFEMADESVKPNRSDDESLCFASAKEAMAGVAPDSYSLDDQISSSAYDAVQMSDEGKAARAAAQACMTDEGLVIDPDSGHPRSDASAGNSEANIRIAVIEATCNVETGAIQTLYDLTARYQAALIDRNEAAAVVLAEQKAELIAGYQKIIDESK